MTAQPLRLVLVFLFATAGIRAADTPAPLPTEIKLTGGGTLHNAKIERFEKTRVVIRHQAGIDGIPYVNIAQPARELFEKARDRSMAGGGSQTSVPNGKTKIFQGQAFIATRGGNSAKLGSVKVYAFPLSVLLNFETKVIPVYLPNPVAKAVTDADGKFTLQVPEGEQIFIFAQGSRVAGDSYEEYEWRIKESDIPSPGNVLLENSNHFSSLTRVSIAGN